MRTFVTVFLCTSCTTIEATVPSGDENACERAADVRGQQCGTVYQFATPCPNEIGHIEICVLDEDLEAAIAKYGPAQFTSRNDFDEVIRLGVPPPCFWPGPGCNALNGCWPHESCAPAK